MEKTPLINFAIQDRSHLRTPVVINDPQLIVSLDETLAAGKLKSAIADTGRAGQGVNVARSNAAFLDFEICKRPWPGHEQYFKIAGVGTIHCFALNRASQYSAVDDPKHAPKF